MKPLSDKQAQAIMKLYPEMQWEQVRNLSAQEASAMISEKWGDSKPRNSAGWRQESINAQNLPITPVKSLNGARVGCAVNNATLLIVHKLVVPATNEPVKVKEFLKSTAKDILQVMDELEAGK